MQQGVMILLILLNIAACNDQADNSTTPAEQVHSELKSDTINKPETVLPASDGALRLTAQNGKGVGPDIKYMPEWKAFGWFTAADRVEWDVEVIKAGEYEVHLEWSVSDEEAGKEFLLEAGGQKLTGIVAKSGSWETYKTENVGRIKLEPGLQKIVFRSNQHFDKGAILDLREVKLVAVK